MNAKRIRIIEQWRLPKTIRLVLFLSLILSLKAFGDPIDKVRDGPYSRMSLRDLEGVAIAVMIDGLSPKMEQLGLTTAHVQTDVELRLRKAGIRVLGESERLAAPGNPYLDITVAILEREFLQREDLSLCIYTIKVALRQEIVLQRDIMRDAEAGVRKTRTTLLATDTWSSQFLGSVGCLYVRHIRDPIADLVDQFINAYLSVNSAPTGDGSPSPPPTVKEKRH